MGSKIYTLSKITPPCPKFSPVHNCPAHPSWHPPLSETKEKKVKIDLRPPATFLTKSEIAKMYFHCKDVEFLYV